MKERSGPGGEASSSGSTLFRRPATGMVVTRAEVGLAIRHAQRLMADVVVPGRSISLSRRVMVPKGNLLRICTGSRRASSVSQMRVSERLEKSPFVSMVGCSTRHCDLAAIGQVHLFPLEDLDRDRVLVFPEVPVIGVLLADLERRHPHEVEESGIIERLRRRGLSVWSRPCSRKKPESG